MFGAILVVVLVVAVLGVGIAVAMGKNHVLVGATDSRVATGRRGAERRADDLDAAAAGHGWQVQRGAGDGHTFPADLAMRYAPPVRCELVVTGQQPRPFTAELWLVDQHKPGAPAGAEMRQHLLSMPLAVRVPRFAVGKDGVNEDAAAWSVPDDLTGAGSRGLDRLSVLGDDQGLAQWLRPWFPQIRDARIWVVVAGDRLVLSRYGAIGTDELVARLELAGALAAALEQAAGAVGGAGDGDPGTDPGGAPE